MARKIRCNDEVIVLVGRDKGRRGKVQRIVSSDKVVVTGINMIKKHQKPIPSKNKVGGIFQQEAAIDISNLAIFNVDLCRGDRIGFKVENGKKIRFFKSTGKILK